MIPTQHQPGTPWKPRAATLAAGPIPSEVPPLRTAVCEPDAPYHGDYVGNVMAVLLAKYRHLALAAGVSDDGKPVWVAEVGEGEGHGDTAISALRRAEAAANRARA